MEFHILGPISLRANGQLVQLGSTKTRAMLAILLLAKGSAISTDTLVERLWDDRTARPRTALYPHVSRLRSALARAETGLKVEHENGSYRLAADPETVDYHRFKALTSRAKMAADGGHHDVAEATYTEALDLWRNAPLTELNTTWARQFQETAVQWDLLPAFQGLFDAQLELGVEHVNQERLRALMDEYRTDETFSGQWMRVLAATKRFDQLRSHYRLFSERVRRQLKLAPSPQFVALYTELANERRTASGSMPGRPPQAFDQLPRTTRQFIGRATVLDEIDELMLDPAGAPVLAISGTPGIGKTTLVTHWAHQRRSDFPDGVLFADLSGHGPTEPMTASAVLGKFLNDFGISSERMPRADTDRAKLLRRMLTGRRLLIVLDNARDSIQLKLIMDATAPCAVAITSRQQLVGLDYRVGAHLVALSVLDPAESVDLLVRRIGRTRAEVDPHALAELAELCAGLPMGLRIASEHIAVNRQVPVRELVDELRERRRLLLDAGSHGDDSTITLRAIFSWSLDTLDHEMSRIFLLLGLFPGTRFSIPAVAAMAGLSVEAAERLLGKLQGASLIDRYSAKLFGIHDLLYLFANGLVNNEPIESRTNAMHRLADFYLGSLRNALGLITPQSPPVPPVSDATDAQPLEFTDYDMARDWCVAERTNLLAVTEQCPQYELNAHCWRMIGQFGEMLTRYGDLRKLVGIHRIALESARICADNEGIAGLLNNTGTIHLTLQEFDEAAREFIEARANDQRTGDRDGEAISTMNLATAHVGGGDFDTALELFDVAIQIFREVGNQVGEAHANHRIGDAHSKMGDYDTAAEHYEIALQLRNETGLPRGQGDTLTSLGELSLLRDDPMAAIGYLQQAITFHEHTLDEHRKAAALLALASAFYAINRYADAARTAHDAVRAAASDPPCEGRSLDILAQAQEALGNHGLAVENWTRARELLTALADPHADTVRQHLETISPT